MTTTRRATPWRPIATATALGAAIALIITSQIQKRDTTDLAERLTTAETEARDANNRATRAREQASELIDFFVENLREELEPIGRTDIIQSAARQAELYFESLPPGERGTISDFHHAKMLLARAQAHYDQGALPESRTAFEEALAMLASIDAEQQIQPVTDLLAMTHNELALTESQSGDFESARTHNEASLAIYKKLASREPGEPQWLHGIAAAQLGIAETLRREDRRTEAIEFYDLAIASAKKSLDTPQENPSHIATQMYAHTNKGLCLTKQKKFAPAEAEIQAASTIAERLIELEPKRKKWKKEYATLVNNFGSVLDNQGQTERALTFVKKARTLRKELVAFDPNNGNWRYDLANSEYNLAMNFLERGEIPQAWASTQQYLGHTSTMLRTEPDNTGWHRDLNHHTETLTKRFEELGANVESAKTHERLINLYLDLSQLSPSNSSLKEYLADAYYEAGSARKRSRDFESSLAHQKQNLQLRLELHHAAPEEHSPLYQLASAIGNYAQSLYNLDRHAEALTHFQFAYATYQRVPQGHRSRDRYLQLDEMNIRKTRVKLGLIKKPPVTVPPDAIWHYWDQGKVPPADWKDQNFDTTTWKSGPAQLGYGDGDEKTKLDYGSDKENKHPTTYFRHQFEITYPNEIKSLHLDLVRDDGAIVYLNGQEIARDMMPEGPATFQTYATGFTSNNIENDPVWFDLPTETKLKKGTNTLAAEVHQSDPASSDLSFALTLYKNAKSPPPLEGMNNTAYQRFLSSQKDKLP